MQKEDVRAKFDEHAASYDRQIGMLSAVRDALHFLVSVVLSELPAEARVLCVGAGTGTEILYLALKFPQWRFTAVEPSAPMLDVCRRRLEDHGIASRCTFHEGYLDELPFSEPYDAATSLLVSQFILDREARSDFFLAIAERLRPSGLLVSADLASDVRSAAFESLLEVWLRMMSAGNVTPEMLERARDAYEREVAVLRPEDVGAIIAAGGFETPVMFFQGGLMHAWYCERTSSVPGR
jgi:tRNA (cmo5U34)-methyltransferase